MLKLCNAVYWLMLTIWVSVLISAGVAAMSAFTTLPDQSLGLRLDAFAQYDHAQHGRVAAGHVMEPIFTFVDLAQAPVSVLAVAMLLLQLTVFKMPWRSPSNIIRTLAVVLALGLFAWRIVTITPEMNRDLRSYWHAAQAGEVAEADRHLAAFNANHPRARNMMDATLVLLLVAIAASAVAMTPANTHARKKDELEQPKLVQKT